MDKDVAKIAIEHYVEEMVSKSALKDFPEKLNLIKAKMHRQLVMEEPKVVLDKLSLAYQMMESIETKIKRLESMIEYKDGSNSASDKAADKKFKGEDTHTDSSDDEVLIIKKMRCLSSKNTATTTTNDKDKVPRDNDKHCDSLDNVPLSLRKTPRKRKRSSKYTSPPKSAKKGNTLERKSHHKKKYKDEEYVVSTTTTAVQCRESGFENGEPLSCHITIPSLLKNDFHDININILDNSLVVLSARAQRARQESYKRFHKTKLSVTDDILADNINASQRDLEDDVLSQLFNEITCANDDELRQATNVLENINNDVMDNYNIVPSSFSPQGDFLGFKKQKSTKRRHKSKNYEKEGQPQKKRGRKPKIKDMLNAQPPTKSNLAQYIENFSNDCTAMPGSTTPAASSTMSQPLVSSTTQNFEFVDQAESNQIMYYLQGNWENGGTCQLVAANSLSMDANQVQADNLNFVAPYDDSNVNINLPIITTNHLRNLPQSAVVQNTIDSQIVNIQTAPMSIPSATNCENILQNEPMPPPAHYVSEEALDLSLKSNITYLEEEEDQVPLDLSVSTAIQNITTTSLPETRNDEFLGTQQCIVDDGQDDDFIRQLIETSDFDLGLDRLPDESADKSFKAALDMPLLEAMDEEPSVIPQDTAEALLNDSTYASMHEESSTHFSCNLGDDYYFADQSTKEIFNHLLDIETPTNTIKMNCGKNNVDEYNTNTSEENALVKRSPKEYMLEICERKSICHEEHAELSLEKVQDQSAAKISRRRLTVAQQLDTPVNLLLRQIENEKNIPVHTKTKSNIMLERTADNSLEKTASFEGSRNNGVASKTESSLRISKRRHTVCERINTPIVLGSRMENYQQNLSNQLASFNTVLQNDEFASTNAISKSDDLVKEMHRGTLGGQTTQKILRRRLTVAERIESPIKNLLTKASNDQHTPLKQKENSNITSLNNEEVKIGENLGDNNAGPQKILRRRLTIAQKINSSANILLNHFISSTASKTKNDAEVTRDNTKTLPPNSIKNESIAKCIQTEIMNSNAGLQNEELIATTVRNCKIKEENSLEKIVDNSQIKYDDRKGTAKNKYWIKKFIENEYRNKKEQTVTNEPRSSGEHYAELELGAISYIEQSIETTENTIRSQYQRNENSPNCDEGENCRDEDKNTIPDDSCQYINIAPKTEQILIRNENVYHTNKAKTITKSINEPNQDLVYENTPKVNTNEISSSDMREIINPLAVNDKEHGNIGKLSDIYEKTKTASELSPSHIENDIAIDYTLKNTMRENSAHFTAENIIIDICKPFNLKEPNSSALKDKCEIVEQHNAETFDVNCTLTNSETDDSSFLKNEKVVFSIAKIKLNDEAVNLDYAFLSDSDSISEKSNGEGSPCDKRPINEAVNKFKSIGLKVVVSDSDNENKSIVSYDVYDEDSWSKTLTSADDDKSGFTITCVKSIDKKEFEGVNENNVENAESLARNNDKKQADITKPDAPELKMSLLEIESKMEENTLNFEEDDEDLDALVLDTSSCYFDSPNDDRFKDSVCEADCNTRPLSPTIQSTNPTTTHTKTNVHIMKPIPDIPKLPSLDNILKPNITNTSATLLKNYKIPKLNLTASEITNISTANIMKPSVVCLERIPSIDGKTIKLKDYYELINQTRICSNSVKPNAIKFPKITRTIINESAVISPNATRNYGCQEITEKDKPVSKCSFSNNISTNETEVQKSTMKVPNEFYLQRSLYYGVTELSQIFGVTCLPHLENRCLTPCLCTKSHLFKDTDSVFKALAAMNKSDFNKAYTFMYNHSMLYRQFFVVFCNIHTARNDREKLFKLVNDCERYPENADFLILLFEALVKCGLSPLNASRLILKRSRDRSTPIIDALVAIIMKSDWTMFLDYIESFTGENYKYNYRIAVLEQMAPTILTSKQANLKEVFFKCVQTLHCDELPLLCNCSPSLLQCLALLASSGTPT